MKEEALALAALGFRVHPLYAMDKNGECMCPVHACPTAGKHPRLPDWPNKATSQPSIVGLWWDMAPFDGIGIATGDGMVVIDLDGPEAEAAWTAFEGDGAPWVVKTGRIDGGKHLYYRTDERVPNSAGRLGAGIDVRGDGGYVVAPPTTHKSGVRYSWSGEAPQPGELPPRLPQKVLDKLLEPAAPAYAPLDWEVGEDGITGWPFGTLSQGDRNVSLTRYVGALFAAQLNDNEVYELALLANKTYLDPPLPLREITTIVRSISRRDAHQQDMRDPDPVMDKPILRNDNAAPVLNTKSKFQLVRASTIRVEPISWVWEGYLGRKMVTNLSGDGGVGKSLLTVDIAARLSTGAGWPDGKDCDKGTVIMLNAEDDSSTILVPRLRAAGADLSNVHIGSDVMRFPADLDELGGLMSVLEPSLLVIDPILDFLDSRIDPSNGAQVSSLISKLTMLAIKHDCAVVIVQHLRKQEGSAIYKAGGAVQWITRCRVAIQVAKDKNEKGRALMTHPKGNYTQEKNTWAYAKITDQGQPVVVWEPDPVDMDADEALTAPSTDDRTARQWLLMELSDGPQVVRTVEEHARDAGITAIDLTKARMSLKVASTKSVTGATHWALPGHEFKQSTQETDEWA